jgi:hypothetical protein
MKYAAIAAAALGLAMISNAGTAKAEDFGVSIRTGGDRHYSRHHHWRGDYARASHCRVVVKHRINAHGDRVTVRKRICD